MIPGFQVIDSDLVSDIKGKLDRAGIFYRLFNRIKDLHSVEEKIKKKGHYSEDKKMQDIFGIRIITYFNDDVDLIYNYLKEDLDFLDEQIDVPNLTEFKPKRTNLIFKLNPELEKMFRNALDTLSYDFCNLLDSTFELQLRTIFSEGWHEIDHSLRYKCQENWTDLDEEERLFNGIFASLEISDMILSKLFDDMSYSHFKRKNLDNLVRTKFRLKFGTLGLSKRLETYIIDVVPNLVEI
ncbi:MAG TPA: GTP pyrophosphokinase [Bacteroides sp.]|nr:GTP pyrophosphokinase [Bacteroides sp.]